MTTTHNRDIPQLHIPADGKNSTLINLHDKPADWVGIAAGTPSSESSVNYWYLGFEDKQRSYTPLVALSYDDAVIEVSERKLALLDDLNSDVPFDGSIQIITGASIDSNMRFTIEKHEGSNKPYVLVDNNTDPAEDAVTYSFTSMKKAEDFKRDMETEHGAMRTFLNDNLRLGRVDIKHTSIPQSELIEKLKTDISLVVLNEHGDKFKLKLDPLQQDVIATHVPERSELAKKINASPEENRVIVYRLPSSFSPEAMNSYRQLEASFFSARWEKSTGNENVISLPVNEITHFRLRQKVMPATFGNHPFIQYDMKLKSERAAALTQESTAKFDALTGDRAEMKDFVESLHRHADLKQPVVLDVAAELINLVSMHKKVNPHAEDYKWHPSVPLVDAKNARDAIEQKIFDVTMRLPNAESVWWDRQPNVDYPVKLQFTHNQTENGERQSVKLMVPTNESITLNNSNVKAIIDEFAPEREAPFIIVKVENTDNAAFVDLGVHEEIARVLTEAAQKLKDADMNAVVLPLVLHDLNGNRVGSVEETYLKSNDVNQMEPDIGQAIYAFECHYMNNFHKGDVIDDVAKEVRKGKENFLIVDGNFAVVGRAKSAIQPTLDNSADYEEDYKKAQETMFHEQLP